MNLTQLKRFANEFLQTNYNMSMNIPLEINGRYKTKLGCFYHKRSIHQSTRIALSKSMYESGDTNKILDVLKHELIHYALYEKGLPYKDGQSYFENELKKHGISSTGTYGATGHRYVISCTKCNRIAQTWAKRTQKLERILKQLDRCTCGRCNTKTLKYDGYIQFDNGVRV
jgi:SprT-like protein